MLDICGRVCYYNYRKRKEARKMADYWEILGDAMDELRAWEEAQAEA